MNQSGKKINHNQLEKKQSPKWFFLLMILIPVLFFILLEISLRIFNYGIDNEQWTEATKGKLMLNPEVARRYFYSVERIPYSIQDIFDEKKKPNAYRIFVLGESSAAGYPFSPLGAFSRYLRDRLELLYPTVKIEVVNLGLTAVNSYTLRDLFPGVLEQNPNLVLIYTGHNEYYGALGVGSMESLGTSREMVNLILYLNRFKTIELLRNVIQGTWKLFSSEEEGQSGTLMSRMARDQYISLNSESYNDGVSQFEGNMRDILEMAKGKNVPVILSTLASNLKDQFPFVSMKSDKMPKADLIFTRAKEEFNSGNYVKADSLFRLAKDLDGLRFRAPEEINRIIESLGKYFNFPVVDADSAFASISPEGITGNNLMTDHLHPTLQGYQFLGKIFFDKMRQVNCLPHYEPKNLSEQEQDSITSANFHFTELDSVVSNFRIKILKNDWPFITKGNKLANSTVLNLKNVIDSLAAQILYDKITWEEAHRKIASYYIGKRDINSFLEEMDALISQYPIVVEYYDYVANVLLPVKDYNRAYKYLMKGYKIKPGRFTAKWLGIIDLYNNKMDSAEKYLKESLTYDNKDSQVWYNLAGVYVKKNNYKQALENVNKALSLQPNYLEASNLQRQLQNAVDRMN